MSPTLNIRLMFSKWWVLADRGIEAVRTPPYVGLFKEERSWISLL
jgi:hypothetical protein